MPRTATTPQELAPVYSHQKSFYKRAHAVPYDDGAVGLVSYGSLIAVMLPGEEYPLFIPYLEGRWSATTQKHVNDFVHQWNALGPIGKKATLAAQRMDATEWREYARAVDWGYIRAAVPKSKYY